MATEGFNTFVLGQAAATALVAADSIVVIQGGATKKASPSQILVATFNASVTDATPGTSTNNYAPAGYSAGVTNRLLVAAASGGTTITGLLAAPDGWTLLIRNTSTTDTITFPHLSGSSLAANQFSNSQALGVILPPNTSALLTYISNVWTFSS